MRMLLFFFLSLLAIGKTHCKEEYSIAFVHLGPALPAYTEQALKQARFFNPNCEIYFLLSDEAFPIYDTMLKEKMKDCKFTLINLSSLPLSEIHLSYKKCSAKKFNLSYKNGFWGHVTERFFYLEEFMKEYGISNLFHLENDVLLYTDFSTLLSTFDSLNSQLAIPFQYRTNCVPSLLFIKNKEALHNLNENVLRQVSSYSGTYPERDINDMSTIANFHQNFGDEFITPLPILMPMYSQFYEKRNIPVEHGNTSIEFLYKYEKDFPFLLFDGATLGIYLSGYDPILNTLGPGAIHYRSLFDPSKFRFFWNIDHQGKKIPCCEFKGTIYRIANLHIHGKNLEKYATYELNSRETVEKLDPQDRGILPQERKL